MCKINVLLCFVVVLVCVGCTTQPPIIQPQPEGPQIGMANPASQNCIAKGGRLVLETRGDGGQYGVCFFEDNRQCEEWALFNGECPEGGLKVTGYVTKAAQYCVITGGSYTITGESNTPNEQGTCTYPSGSVCDVWALFNGMCDPNQPPAPTAVPETQPVGDVGRIVFDSTRQGMYRNLFLMNADGSNVTQLASEESNQFAGPGSPDGQRILYTGFGPMNSYIASMLSEGGGQAIVMSYSGSDEAFPAWSPDGQKIAFTSRRDGDNEIYVIQADGSNLQRLTNHTADDFSPAWSPDGQKIVFVSDRDQMVGVYDLFIMNADGTDVRRLTNDPYPDYAPAWSPDGSMVAYQSFPGGAGEIFVINVDGSNLRNLTQNPADDWAPTWSPDGSLVLFQSNRDGNWEIYQMAADGSGQVNLTNHPADDQLPYWVP